MNRNITSVRIGIIGLGYVGLPLQASFTSKGFDVVGFDINGFRVTELAQGYDRTGEVGSKELLSKCCFTESVEDIKDCNTYIITVPTPVDSSFRPNMSPLLSASELVSHFLKPGDVVIYESTVYPGATEEECVPVLELGSGFSLNKEFYVGYSPERINPGDKMNTLETITKVTSGSNAEAAHFVDWLYQQIIRVGTYSASSIRVAEASKVIENAQRDLNIAFMNELSQIFNKIGIDTNEVIDAASTKWNFLPFRPGLVGGHCIGVDPYYLAYKAESVGYKPDVIMAGRRINNEMGRVIADNLVESMLKKGVECSRAKILILGFSFKENCPDVRNTKVIDILRRLESLNMDVTVSDQIADPELSKTDYEVNLVRTPSCSNYDAIVLAVPHKYIVDRGIEYIDSLRNDCSVFFDIKGAFGKDVSDFRL